jgi:hypothetical protein
MDYDGQILILMYFQHALRKARYGGDLAFFFASPMRMKEGRSKHIRSHCFMLELHNVDFKSVVEGKMNGFEEQKKTG